MIPTKISELPNNGVKVLLMRRTGHSNVKTSVGYRDAFGKIYGWYGKLPPTHWCDVPVYEKSK